VSNWRHRGIVAALGAAPLFGVGTPFAKLLLEATSPGLLAGILYLYLGAGIGLAALRWSRPAHPVRLAPRDIGWLAGTIAAGGIARSCHNRIVSRYLSIRFDGRWLLKPTLAFILTVFGATIVTTTSAATISFDQDTPGAAPSGWHCGVTGRGSPKWLIEKDASAPSKPNVLKQSGSGTFPWCVRPDVKVADGHVEVRFKSISGREDQAAGLVWRWKDGDNYYVARANALENNVSLYYTANGRRNTLKYVDAPVAVNAWHTLRVAFSGKRIKVALNGKTYIELEDEHIVGPGAVGVWTKADSVTAFDDFAYRGSM